MVKNAIAWAKANKLTRTNEVHGAEEYRVKTFESFSQKNVDRTIQRASVECEVEDHHCLFLFASGWMGC